MKQTLLFIIAFFSSCMSYAQTVITPNKDTVIATTVTTMVVKPYKAPPIIVTPPPVIVPPSGTLNAQENLFDAVHYALGSTVDKNGSVTSIPAMKVGNYFLPMVYGGISNPTVTKIPPITITDQDGKVFVQFDNQPQTGFYSSQFNKVSPPFEVWYIDRNLPGQNSEAKSEGYPNTAYLADVGNTIRVSHNDITVPNSQLSPNYQMTIERMVVNTTGCDYYQNGVFIGTAKYSAADIAAGAEIKSQFNIGTYTNNKDWDFAALYFKAGTFSTTDATTIYNSLASKWGAGSLPTGQTLLYNITWVKSGTKAPYTYTPTATDINGKSIDISKGQYQWFWEDDQGNYANQTMFSNSNVVHTGDFPANDSTHSNVLIKFRVNLGWRWLSGTFLQY